MIKNKKILVTGGAGMIGSNIIKKLSTSGAQVTVLDNLSAYPFDYLKEYDTKHIKNVNFVKGNVVNKKIVNELIKKMDIVIHAAALADVGACVRNPILEHKMNVSATNNILDACKKHNLEKFIFVSSAAVYGIGEGKVFREDLPCFPISNYALSKFWGEQQSRLYYELYGLPTTSLRFFSVYGSPQVPKKGSHSWCVAIFGMLAKKHKPITVFGDGNQIRDFIHVNDIAKAVVLSTDKKSTNGKFFNVGTGKPTTINTIVKKVFGRVEKVPVEYKPHPLGDPLGGYADITLMKKLLSWKPKFSLDKGLDEYFEWLNKNERLIPKWM